MVRRGLDVEPGLGAPEVSLRWADCLLWGGGGTCSVARGCGSRWYSGSFCCGGAVSTLGAFAPGRIPVNQGKEDLTVAKRGKKKKHCDREAALVAVPVPDPDAELEGVDMALEAATNLQIAYFTLLKLVAWLAGQVSRRGGKPVEGVEARAEVGASAHGGRVVRMVFTVSPLPFNAWFRTNSAVPWTLHAEAQERDVWRECVGRAVLRLGWVDWLPFRRAAVHFTFTRKRETSCDAFVHCVRYILDALVEHRVLESDSGTTVWYSCRTAVADRDTVEVVVEEEGGEGG